MLTIFHYVVAGCAALFSCFPVIYIILGLVLALAPGQFRGDHGEPAPPFLGWILVAVGSVLVLLGWAYAALVFAAGRSLARRKHHTFCLVMGGVECLFMPFGTVLGIFTIITLTQEPTKQLFASGSASPSTMPPRI